MQSMACIDLSYGNKCQNLTFDWFLATDGLINLFHLQVVLLYTHLEHAIYSIYLGL